MRNKFTNREKKLLFYTTLLFGVLLILWIVFAPNRGIFDMVRTHEELEKLQAKNTRLLEENKALQVEINRLQDDPTYLE